MMQGDYPIGANTKKAPWNEHDNPKRDFSLYISQSFSKDVECKSTNYSIQEVEEDGFIVVDDSNTNFYEIYKESHYTIQDLLQKLKLYIQKDIQDRPNCKKKLEELLKECDSWICDEEVVLPNS